MSDDYKQWLEGAAARVQATRAALRDLGAVSDLKRSRSDQQAVIPFELAAPDREIYEALSTISLPLGQSYAQVKRDLYDNSRTSWAGTAHEVREILATLLRLTAPDAAVRACSWYRQEPNTSGPTQKQRVRYILSQHGAGSKEREVVEEVTTLEGMIGDVVRAMYSRASDAAHRFKDKREITRITRYFEAFARDLLNLD